MNKENETSGVKKVGFWAKIKRVFTTHHEHIHNFRKRLVIGIIIGIAALAVIFLVVFGIGIYKYNWDFKIAASTKKIIPYPATMVGANFVSLEDYDQRIKYLEHYYSRTKQKPEKDFKKTVLEDMINQKVFEQQARKYQLNVSDDEVNSVYQELAMGEGGEQKLVKLLNDLWGFDAVYFKELIRNELLVQKLNSEVPQTVHLKHVLLKITSKTSKADAQKIKKLATIYKTQIETGNRKFDPTVKKFSEDTATKDQGGDLGWLSQAEVQTKLGKDCVDKIFNLRVGGYDACRSKYGYNIVYNADRKGKVDKSFNDWFLGVKKETFIWRMATR